MITTLGRLDRLQESGQLDALLRSAVRFSKRAALLEVYKAGVFPEAQTTRIVGIVHYLRPGVLPYDLD